MTTDYDPVLQAIEQDWIDRRQRVRHFLLDEGRPDLLAEYDAKMRDLDSGVMGAQSTWHSISATQRRALTEAAEHGGKLVRVGKEYRHGARNQPYKPIYVKTVRNLCSRDLLAWDGGAFDPESAAVVTERGLFVLSHGPVRLRIPNSMVSRL